MLGLHGVHLREGRRERELSRVAGEDPGDHGVDQDLGGLPADPAAGEVEDGLVAIGPAAGEGFAEDPQSAAERQEIGGGEGDGRGRHRTQSASAEDEPVPRGVRRRDQRLAETDGPRELEGVGGVVEKALRSPFHGVAGFELGADLAARAVGRLEHDRVVDPVVAGQPLGGRQTGDPGADDGDAGVGGFAHGLAG